VNEQGVPFWSGPKRAPEPVTFDSKDDLHLHFVAASANLIAFTLKIEQKSDMEEVRTLIEAST